MHKCVQNVVYEDQKEEEATIEPASEGPDRFQKILLADFMSYKELQEAYVYKRAHRHSKRGKTNDLEPSEQASIDQ